MPTTFISLDTALSLSAALTGAVTMLIAIVALFIARKQIRSTREVEALNAYEKYHHLCLLYPELGCGEFDYANSSIEERRRYITFALSMLLTVERILVLFPRNKVWRASFFDDFAQHEAFLRSSDFDEFRPTMDRGLLKLIDSFLRSSTASRG